ncbi:TrbI/VirB10 family protein [Salmonella enterica]|nr:TrbI/VirB10 family protein [Salmonella enterica]EGL4359790.1 TrbI/VirB10 family protein [Salmonella enterica]EGL4382743.1 TrbI/VirB10 family protein [Salmonella enterica]EGL4487989.1 TrbI/VirB10 family protein [Salmonella enterica]EGL4515149.1 TrbI/VirB10 family protein [Salmonella enterica]
MTDKKHVEDNDDALFVEEHDTVDSEEQDTDAQNRNLIHSGKKRSSKKAKALLALTGFAFVGILMLVIGLSQFFKKTDEEEKAPTTAETEIYARDTRTISLDDIKKNILGNSIDEVKNSVESADDSQDKKESASDTADRGGAVTLPAGESQTAAPDGDAPPTPAQRRLTGSALLDDSRITQSQKVADNEAVQEARDDRGNGDFLRGADFQDGSVTKLKNRRYLLSAGTVMSCVLKTRIVTSYPGVTLCQVTKDVLSDDGKTVLIRGGAQLQGEQTKVIQQGMARVFVNWTTVKDGNIRVRIDALGADGLGASGIPAWVDNHFWQRFGGALMLSFIEDFLDAGSSQLSKQNSSQFTMNNTTDAGGELAKTTLDNSINIPPTAYVNQGEMMSVIIPRNIDFSPVYEVK